MLDDTFEHDRLVQFLQDRRWSMVAQDVTGDGEAQVVEEVWTDPGKTRAIHYLDDRTMLTRYLWIRGQEITSLVSELVRHFGIHPVGELVQEVADAESRTITALVAALFRLAVGNHEVFDGEALETFGDFSQHPSSVVRHAVVQSLLFTGWPQGVDILNTMAAQDPASEVREFASRAAIAVSKGLAGP